MDVASSGALSILSIILGGVFGRWWYHRRRARMRDAARKRATWLFEDHFGNKADYAEMTKPLFVHIITQDLLKHEGRIWLGGI